MDMDNERFVASQQKGINFIFVAFCCLVTTMWVATVLDWAINLGWGWDRQGLWLGPLMVLFAVLVRFCATAILKFVRSNY